MTNDEKVRLVIQRFFHRQDVYALQQYDEARGTGYYPARKGKCQHVPPCPRRECPDVETIPLTKKDVYLHLQGKHTIGVYQLKDETVTWGCLDIDGKKVTPQEQQQFTLTLTEELAQRIGRRFLVEDSGNKGYHVWIFFQEPVPASQVSLFLHSIEKDARTPEGLTIEVYPKQTGLVKFGNLVKLPLGIHQKTGQRCFFVNRSFQIHEDQWKVLQGVEALSQKQLDYLTQDLEPLETSSTTPQEVSRFVLPCQQRMMHEGIQEGGRDEGTFRVACNFRSQGMPYEIAEAALHAFNMKNNPPLPQHVVEDKLRSAYSGSYSPLPCGISALDPFCSSSCFFFPRKCESRGFNPKSAVGRISRD